MSPSESVELRLRAGSVVESESPQEKTIIDRLWDEGKLNMVFSQGEFMGYRMKQENTPLPRRVFPL